MEAFCQWVFRLFIVRIRLVVKFLVLLDERFKVAHERSRFAVLNRVLICVRLEEHSAVILDSRLFPHCAHFSLIRTHGVLRVPLFHVFDLELLVIVPERANLLFGLE